MDCFLPLFDRTQKYHNNNNTKLLVLSIKSVARCKFFAISFSFVLISVLLFISFMDFENFILINDYVRLDHEIPMDL